MIRNLTNSSNAFDRNPAWSPNGKFIAYISDVTGEDEIYLIEDKFNAKPIQLTNKGGSYKYSPSWSPDGKKIMWTDRELKVKFVDVNTKEITIVTKGERGRNIYSSWSPDTHGLLTQRLTQVI